MKKIVAVVLALSMAFSLAACGDTSTENIDESAGTESLSIENVIFVDGNAQGSNDGSTWSNAYTLLQDALAVSEAENEIWVAEGTYYPTEDDDISISFQMVDDVAMYGGFSGTETSLEERDWEENVTILSGDIGVKDDSSDNAVKVVIAANALLDGFTISGGAFSQTEMGPPSDSDSEMGEKPEGELPGDKEAMESDSSSASSTGILHRIR